MARPAEQNEARPAGEVYASTVLTNLEEAVFPCESITTDMGGKCTDCGVHADQHHTENFDMNHHVLEVVRYLKPSVFTYEDDDGEEQEYTSDDFAEVSHVAFVLTTGGPHFQIETTDKGRTWFVHYWHWFRKDEYRRECTAAEDGILQAAFGPWFEGFSEFRFKAGASVDLSRDACSRHFHDEVSE